VHSSDATLKALVIRLLVENHHSPNLKSPM